ncbi:MAG TPA: hypothetical protein VFA70_03775, partial [Dehalococcoidia bacterium]|nr:hypothetical protein [Dehalococcoidia bacterium]
LRASSLASTASDDNLGYQLKRVLLGPGIPIRPHDNQHVLSSRIEVGSICHTGRADWAANECRLQEGTATDVPL